MDAEFSKLAKVQSQVPPSLRTIATSLDNIIKDLAELQGRVSSIVGVLKDDHERRLLDDGHCMLKLSSIVSDCFSISLGWNVFPSS